MLKMATIEKRLTMLEAASRIVNSGRALIVRFIAAKEGKPAKPGVLRGYRYGSNDETLRLPKETDAQLLARAEATAKPQVPPRCVAVLIELRA